MLRLRFSPALAAVTAIPVLGLAAARLHAQEPQPPNTAAPVFVNGIPAFQDSVPWTQRKARVSPSQTPAVPREHRIRDAVVGAIVGGATGAAIGFAVGSMGNSEPSCLSSPCEGHSYARQGARVGLVVGIPLGAIIGWRGAFRSRFSH